MNNGLTIPEGVKGFNLRTLLRLNLTFSDKSTFLVKKTLAENDVQY